MTTERRPIVGLDPLNLRGSHLPTLGLGVALVLLLALLLVPRPAAAQENPHGDLDRSCTDCHTVESWSPLKEHLDFDHAETGFPLASSHRRVDCLSCHGNLRFQLVPTSCFDCHEDPHRGEMGYDCDTCHVAAGWENRGELFDRHSASLFPLTGAANTPTDCFACHSSDYGAAQPDHLESGFPIECEACHTTRTWLGADFDHELIFPLRGAHRILDCAECHTDGFNGGLPTDCYGCHKQDYDNTIDPDHVAAGFPMMCEECHDENSWQGADFSHDDVFALTGAHRVLDCEECHADGFSGTPTDCFACHKQDYDSTDDPNHAQAGFSTMCEECHSTSSWDDADLDHDAAFPLTGAHRPLDCDACHADGFAGTPTDCFSCHTADYNNTTDPNHADAGFPTMCEDCHTTSNWNDADFDHDAAFPLTGAHRPLDCDDCHAEGFEGTPTDCFSCHTADYNNTNDPDHANAGFSTMCEDCHNTTDWNDADFDHNDFFALTGAHRTLDCDACHADGFPGTPTDCFSCHRADYNNTDDPDHAAAGFPTMCEDCHNTTNWNDADFDHNMYFPLQGDHNLDCESQACLECHPDGRE